MQNDEGNEFIQQSTNSTLPVDEQKVNLPLLRRSTRAVKMPNRFDDYDFFN